MKKTFALLLALLLLLTPLAAWAEDGDETPPPEPEYEPLPDEYRPLAERVIGDWFADEMGLLVSLTLSEDGTYVLSVPGDEPRKGQWEARDGQLFLDGSEEAAITPVGDVLRFNAPDLLFTREKPETYVPADLFTDAKEGSFDGLWKAQFVAVGDGTILARALGEDAMLLVEGVRVTMSSGQVLGDPVEFTFENGALVLKEGDVSLTLQLQQDGLLRLTLSGEEPTVIYFMPIVKADETPAPETP